MSIEQGWEAVIQRDFDRAEAHFTDVARTTPEAAEAYVGLGRVRVLQGQPQQAEKLAQHALSLNPRDADAQLLVAEIAGEQGRRAEATSQIRTVLAREPAHGFGLALLAEQRLRQGYWDDGAALFTQALNADRSGLAFSHVRNVLVDMSEAIAANKIPRNEALKLLNKIDYNTPNHTTGFFAMARRAIGQGVVLHHTAQAAGEPRAPQRPSSQPARPQHVPGQRLEHAKTPQAGMAQVVRETERAPKKPAMRRDPLRRATPKGMELNLPDIKDDQQLDFMRSIHSDRRLNAQLQDDLMDPGRPDWPSQQLNKLDDMPPIAATSGSALSSSLQDHRDDPFRVTSGNLYSQIYLDRCLEKMLQRVPVQLAGALAISPEEVSQLEVNLLDGMLDEFDDLVTSDLQELELSDARVCALGNFLGESVVRAYGAVWEYNEVPARSRVLIKNHAYSPFEVAQRWLAASDPDEVTLQEFTALVEQSMNRASIDTIRKHEHIDLTSGMRSDVLRIRLAELWSIYRLKLSGTPAIEIGRELEVKEEHKDALIFDLGKRWVPKLSSAQQQRGERTNSSGQEVYALAYIRNTGEFHVLASTKGVAQCIAAMTDELTPQNAPILIKLLSDYHTPQGRLLRNDRDVARSSSARGAQLHKPQLRQGAASGETELVYWVELGERVQAWRLRHAPDAALPWRLVRA